MSDIIIYMDKKEPKNLSVGELLLDESELLMGKKKFTKSENLNEEKELIRLPKASIDSHPDNNELSNSTNNNKRNTDIQELPKEDKLKIPKERKRRYIKLWDGEIFDTIQIEKTYQKRDEIDEINYDKQIEKNYEEHRNKGIYFNCNFKGLVEDSNKDSILINY